MKVELLVAFKDHTWTTQVHEVPPHICRGDQDPIALSRRITDWANDTLSRGVCYGDVDLFAIYSIPDLGTECTRCGAEFEPAKMAQYRGVAPKVCPACLAVQSMGYRKARVPTSGPTADHAADQLVDWICDRAKVVVE